MYARIAERLDEVDDQHRTDHIRNRLGFLADDGGVDEVEKICDEHAGETPRDLSSERHNILPRRPELRRDLRRRHKVQDDNASGDECYKQGRDEVHADSPKND